MARKKRTWYEGACYHVMGRGIRRGIIFKKEEDYSLFRIILKKVQEKYLFILHAYCLMSNHFHMELTTIKDPIWRIMQGLMSSYARTFNQRNHLEKNFLKYFPLKNIQRLDKGDWNDYNVVNLNESSEKYNSE